MTPVSIVFALSISAIAMMSPMSGIYAGILGSFALWMFRGSNLGIAGAAAALAPILAGAVVVLGKGDIAQGQLMVLPVIFMAGVVMLVMGVFKLARFTSVVSPAVIDGAILGYIGYSIVVRQIPIFFGVPFHDKSLTGILYETVTFQHVHEMNMLVFGIGIATLAIIMGHLLIQCVLQKGSYLKKILGMFPPQLFATVVAIYLGYHLTMDPSLLIRLPEEMSIDYTLGFKGAKLLWADPSLWIPFSLFVFKLAMVDAVETSATALGVDNKDKYHRVSDPNKALIAMAVANIVGSPCGNQSHIPGGMKSGTNAVLGAKTRNAALINCIFMAVALLFATTRDVINHIPLVALSAVIGYAGYRLCAPNVWKHFIYSGEEVFRVGKWVVTDAFIVFSVGFFLSAMTAEILVGFFAAIGIEFVLTYARTYRNISLHAHNGVETSMLAVLKKLFRNPVVEAKLRTFTIDGKEVEGVWVVELDGPITSFNFRHIPPHPPNAKEIFVDAAHHEVTCVSAGAVEYFSRARMSINGKKHFRLFPFFHSGREGSGMVRQV